MYKDELDIESVDIESDIRKWTTKISTYDYVIHLAALAGVRRSHEIPVQYWNTNVEGSRNIFNACSTFLRDVPCIYASSSSVYEWWLSPYATTKKVVEEIAPRYSLGLRFHTVYGPDSRPDMLYDKLLKRDKKVEYLTRHTRDYTHVHDVCTAIRLCMDNFSTLRHLRAIDIGNGTPVTVKEMADHVWPGNNLPYRDVAGEREHTCANPAVLKKLGWKAEYNILS